MNKLFVTMPRHDKATEYLYEWSKEILEKAKERGVKVFTADGHKANKGEVTAKLEKISPDFVFFNGHGSESEICGHNDEVILDEDESHLLRGSITFARSCKCLVGLGSAAVENGCQVFVGYSKDFWFPTVEKFEATPLRDPAAIPVFEVSNLIPLKIIKNSSAAEAIKASRSLASKLMLKLVLSKEPYDMAALRALLLNYDCLGFKGDGAARIESIAAENS
ncbi:MAG: hypothetical protein HYW50_00565 [Candidatus Diapherotrites archaeon]|nr:hypothetical protein [Candidatus Diapherotrites archaeon]